MTATSQRFRPHEHIKSRSDFGRVYAGRCSASNDLIVVYVAKNDLAWSRLGISVSKRVGNAVVRSAVRRRAREAFRTSRNRIPQGYDIICVARPTLKNRLCELSGVLVDVVQAAVRRGRRRRTGRPSGT